MCIKLIINSLIYAKQPVTMPVAIVATVVHRVLFAFRLSESSIVLGTQLDFNMCSEKQDEKR